MLSNISKINTDNVCFTKDLYLLLQQGKEIKDERLTRLFNNFNRILSLQRKIFAMQYGTLEQIGKYLLELINNDKKIIIDIKDNDSLLEFIICKVLLIDVQYIINIEQWISIVQINNDDRLVELKELLHITSENISHFNIIRCIETIDKFYLPDRCDVLRQIVYNLSEYYNHQVSTVFNPNLYIITIGRIIDISKYLEDTIKEILNQDYSLDNLEIIDHHIFVKNNFIEIFLDTINSKSTNELEFAMKSLECLVSRTDISKIYKHILKLSRTIIETKNTKLIDEFQHFTKSIDLILKKK